MRREQSGMDSDYESNSQLVKKVSSFVETRTLIIGYNTRMHVLCVCSVRR